MWYRVYTDGTVDGLVQLKAVQCWLVTIWSTYIWDEDKVLYSVRYDSLCSGIEMDGSARRQGSSRVAVGIEMCSLICLLLT